MRRHPYVTWGNYIQFSRTYQFTGPEIEGLLGAAGGGENFPVGQGSLPPIQLGSEEYDFVFCPQPGRFLFGDRPSVEEVLRRMRAYARTQWAIAKQESADAILQAASDVDLESAYPAFDAEKRAKRLCLLVEVMVRQMERAKHPGRFDVHILEREAVAA